jgi:hypothetical protein
MGCNVQAQQTASHLPGKKPPWPGRSKLMIGGSVTRSLAAAAALQSISILEILFEIASN